MATSAARAGAGMVITTAGKPDGDELTESVSRTPIAETAVETPLLSPSGDGPMSYLTVAAAPAFPLRIGSTDELGLTASFTVEMWLWVKRHVPGDAPLLGTQTYEAGKGLHILLRGGEPFFGFHGADTSAEGFVLPTCAWQHVACVYDAEARTQCIFVGGKQLACGKDKAPLEAGGSVLLAYFGDPGRVLDGHICELRLWSRALAAEELLERRLWSADGRDNTARMAAVDEENPAAVRRYRPVLPAWAPGLRAALMRLPLPVLPFGRPAGPARRFAVGLWDFRAREVLGQAAFGFLGASNEEAVAFWASPAETGEFGLPGFVSGVSRTTAHSFYPVASRSAGPPVPRLPTR